MRPAIGDVTRKGSSPTFLASGKGGPSAFEVVLGGVCRGCCGNEVLLRQLERQSGTLQLAGGKNAVNGELARALVVDPALVPRRLRAPECRAGLLERRLGRADALAQLPCHPRVEQGRCRRFEDGDQRALVDPVARAQGDSIEPTCQWRGDDVAIANPRAAVLLDDFLEAAARDPCPIHRDRRRRERPHGRADGARPRAVRRAVVSTTSSSCLLSRLERAHQIQPIDPTAHDQCAGEARGEDHDRAPGVRRRLDDHRDAEHLRLVKFREAPRGLISEPHA